MRKNLSIFQLVAIARPLSCPTSFAPPVVFMQVDNSLPKKPKKIAIGVDLMGSDSSPSLLFEAVIEAANKFGPQVELHAFVSEGTSFPQKMENVILHVTDEVIEMEDAPLEAIRRKKNSSLVTGIRLLKKGGLDAFVSLGNTGALIAASTLNLPLLPGIRRPALLATLPAPIGRISILDVGGSVSYTAEHLISFALMGACFESVQFGVKRPLIGLLNVGTESKKGTEEHRRAYQRLEEISKKSEEIEFIGNLEGSEVFQGKAQVVVTDGFTGNVLLKSAEGIAAYILDYLRQTELRDQLKALESRFSVDEYAGAILLGVEGVVIKCHGRSSAKALFNGIQAAYSYVQKGLILELKEQLRAIEILQF